MPTLPDVHMQGYVSTANKLANLAETRPRSLCL